MATISIQKAEIKTYKYFSYKNTTVLSGDGEYHTPNGSCISDSNFSASLQ
ncbi:MAG: hypothetical protein QXY61_05030 [Candidatus Anstonellales archaeon]